MAIFNPLKYGATPVKSTFDPSMHGAVKFEEHQEFTKLSIEEKTPLGFVKNVGKSAWSLATSLVDMMIHPIETIKGVVGTAAGVVEKVIPGEQKQEVYADALWELMKDRYGSAEAFTNTMYTDPVGFLLDASVVFSGGGTAALKLTKAGQAGKLAKYAKLSEIKRKAAITADIAAGDFGVTAQAALKAQKVGAAINPITMPAKAVSKIIPTVDKYLRNLVIKMEAATGDPLMKALEKPPSWWNKTIAGTPLTPQAILFSTASYALTGDIMNALVGGAVGRYYPGILEAILKTKLAQKTVISADVWLDTLNQGLKTATSATDKAAILAAIDFMKETKDIQEFARISEKIQNKESMTPEEMQTFFGQEKKQGFSEQELKDKGLKPISSSSNTVKLANAIMKVESGGKQVKGQSGEFGLFQFLPGTWKTISKEMFGSVLEQTPANESKVATKKIDQLLKKGWSPLEVALIWNTSLGGVEKPLIKKGTNSQGVLYDSLAYANRVMASFL